MNIAFNNEFADESCMIAIVMRFRRCWRQICEVGGASKKEEKQKFLIIYVQAVREVLWDWANFEKIREW
jgi:hypothetical protein